MKKILLIIFFISTSFLNVLNGQNSDKNCDCKKENIELLITKRNFALEIKTEEDFYKLSKKKNRILWFDDIESPKPTDFTPNWDSYHKKNYHFSRKDFIKKYHNNEEIPIAFNIGPNWDLGAYTLFVVKKINDCYLLTLSYFRHSRFTYKSYSIISECQLDKLFSLLKNITKSFELERDQNIDWDIDACFVDNRNNQIYFPKMYDSVESTELFEGKMTTFITDELNEKMKFFNDYLYKEINWIKTYD